MRQFVLVIALISCLPFKSLSQEENLLYTIVGTNSIDSLIDYRKVSWRVYSVFKFQNIIVRDSEHGVGFRYLPTNPFGLGIGLANDYLIVDVGFNLQLRDNHTERFDLQGSLYLKKKMVDFLLQSYNGYRPAGQSDHFREDIQSQVYSLNYLVNTNKRDFDIKEQFDARYETASDGAWLYGFYAMHSRFYADSSLLSNPALSQTSEELSITARFATTLGISGGYAHSFVFPGKEFVFLAIAPGLGIQHADVQAETGWYTSPVVPVGKLVLRSSIGKRLKNMSYVSLSTHFDVFYSILESKSYWLNNTGKIKLVYGFRLKKKSKQ